jgi:GT2 family glycosyltransferase/2-polyprenyl-3-methyl-5-hydroxy-6-metoxy-1,4-benzoquinol methylase
MTAPVKPLGLTNYFRHGRRHLLEYVPLTARAILDVGCGAGLLGEQLRARQPCEVWGIELEPAAAQAARGRLDRVIEKPIEQAVAELPRAHFDTLIAADVLEHLPDPLAALRALVPALAADATVVISLPNVQHHSVVRDLLRGQFTYRPYGILDQTHLRFFTRASVVELVRRAGLTIERIEPLYAHGRERRAARGQRAPNDIPVAPDVPVHDFYATQFFVVARCPPPPPDVAHLKVSIVMLTWNRFDVTRPAIESVRAHTRQPHELIVVDNGSTDGTAAYLDTLERDGVRVIRNRENRGVAAGWNQGLHVASGDCLMVLNNDVLVADEWLERMVRAAYAIPRTGMVGCRASSIAGPQWLRPDYEDTADFPLFARRYAELADATWFEIPRVVAVAMLWRREVYDRIGDFDEQFGPNLEDDDYSLSALAAGYRNIIANDVFIHHVGSASHTRDRGVLKEVGRRNRDRFIAKWGAAGAPIVATRVMRYEHHIPLLQPQQYVLPGWGTPSTPPRVLARQLARAGRRIGRHGWHREARATFWRSLSQRITLGGLGGLLWHSLPRLPKRGVRNESSLPRKAGEG